VSVSVLLKSLLLSLELLLGRVATFSFTVLDLTKCFETILNIAYFVPGKLCALLKELSNNKADMLLTHLLVVMGSPNLPVTYALIPKRQYKAYVMK